MDEYTVHVPSGVGDLVATECHEPIAEVNFNRKKLSQLQNGIGTLQKATRQHTEVVSQLESEMKSMISETDLRRAIGLAFQEFDHRLEEAFQESGRKCLAMFSRRDEVQELQGLIQRKVSWTEYNAVMKKFADLRQYIDTMARSVFIGHGEALKGEFAKKADRQTIEDALKLKADTDNVNEVRARLERLEVLVSDAQARQAEALEGLRDDIDAEHGQIWQKQQVAIDDNRAKIDRFRGDFDAVSMRMSTCEGGVTAVSKTVNEMRKEQTALQEEHRGVILPKLSAVQDSLDAVANDLASTRQDLQSSERTAEEFREASRQTVQELSSQTRAVKEHVDFLLQEAEMIKRRARELAKKHAASSKDILDAQSKIGQHYKSLEGSVKQQNRDLRIIEGKVAKVETPSAVASFRELPLALANGRASLAQVDQMCAQGDPSLRLQNMMEQLTELAFGPAPHEAPDSGYNEERPPLPKSVYPSTADPDLSRIPKFNSTLGEQAPIDSARGVRGMPPGFNLRAPPGKLNKKKKT